MFSLKGAGHILTTTHNAKMVSLITRTFYSNGSVFKRMASHSTNAEPVFDSAWPKGSCPTPYEIFGMPPGQVDSRSLKKKYHAMAKLYHPDISNGVRILKQNTSHHTLQMDESAVLSAQDKMNRFRIMSEAYELLSDYRKKSTYDRFRSGWDYGPVGNSSDSYASAAATSHGYHQNHHYEYWNAGTWEDVNNLKRSPENKVSVWAVVGWVCGLFVCIQCTALLTRIEESLTKVHYTHDETERDLGLAYMNYGLDTDKWSRLRRFLWFRTYGLYRSKADLDREAQNNERIVQELKSKEMQNENAGA